MIDLHERTRRISASRVEEILRRYECTSVVDPFMGIPTHLNYLKRHGFSVHGGDLLDWFVRAGEGLIANDFTLLRDSEIAEIIEMLPGKIYSVDRFKAWEGVFFTEEQCTYLSVWHDNVHSLRSDGQTGLAVVGLWHVLCYWLQKAHYPDDMQDVAAAELAWSYIRKTQDWVASNLRGNSVRQADVLETINAHEADALFISPPARNSFRSVDARIWMWEAWWQGNPYYNIEQAYQQSLFGKRSADEQGYARAVSSVLSSAQDYRVIVLQTTERGLAEFEPHMRNARPHIEIFASHPNELYLIGTH
jgi:hypothetical protein